MLNEDAVFTPYGGIVLDVTQWASVYYSYTDIFQPNDPFLKDVSGNVLPPEIGVSQEVGLKTEFYDGRLKTWLAFFRIDHSNLAELDPNAPPFSCNCADCYRATGLVVSEGIDVDIAGALSKTGTSSAATPIRTRPTLMASLRASASVRRRFQSVQDGDELLDTEHEMDLRRQPSIPRRYLCRGPQLVHPGHAMAHRAGRRLARRPHDQSSRRPSRPTCCSPSIISSIRSITAASACNYQGQVYGDPRKAALSLRKSF